MGDFENELSKRPDIKIDVSLLTIKGVNHHG